MMEYMSQPMEIERRSMEIITEEMGVAKLDAIPQEMHSLVKRVIHTTADFEYADLLNWSDDFLESVQKALLAQSPVVTDTTMILAGMNKRVLDQMQVSYHCLIKDHEVVQMAKANGMTRSMAAVRIAQQRFQRPIFVVGNAPTAIFQMAELIQAGELQPAAIIGVPVGFVGAAESKELLTELGVPYLITRGRKGGSTVAVSIMNAILYGLKGNITP